MKITKIDTYASRLEKIYEGLRKSLEYLDGDAISKAKMEIKKSIKRMEEIRPDLKNVDKMEAYYKQRGWTE